MYVPIVYGFLPEINVFVYSYSLLSQNPISEAIFMFVSVDGDKMSVDEDKMSVELRSSGRAKWGELVAPLGEISWPKSYFNTRLVDIVYMMHKQR